MKHRNSGAGSVRANGLSRRHFLAAAASSGALAGNSQAQATTSAISFPHSYLHCAPEKIRYLGAYPSGVPWCSN